MSTTVAMIVTDAMRTTVEADIASLTPEYTVIFVRPLAAANPAPTPETPLTHWYMNAQAVPEAVVSAWLAYSDTVPDLKVFAATNIDNPLQWATEVNLLHEGLAFIPYSD